jgi:hypothetical protein
MAAVEAAAVLVVAVQAVQVAVVQVAREQAVERLVLQTLEAAAADLLLVRCQRTEQMVVAALLSFAI